jgi:hypothetical protein
MSLYVAQIPSMNLEAVLSYSPMTMEQQWGNRKQSIVDKPVHYLCVYLRLLNEVES